MSSSTKEGAPATDVTVKLVMLGDTGVGKSSLLGRFATGNFDKFTESTIGVSFVSTALTVDDRVIQFHISDTAGQEKYRGLAPLYYRKAHAAVVVYDITSRSSFVAIQSWVKELQDNGPEGAVICICGNKTDCESSRRVPTDEARAFAAGVGALHFETSAKAKDGLIGIQHMFSELARALPESVTRPAAPKDDIPSLRGPKKKSGSGGGCAC